MSEVAEMQEEGGAQLQPTTFGRLPPKADPSLFQCTGRGLLGKSVLLGIKASRNKQVFSQDTVMSMCDTQSNDSHT